MRSMQNMESTQRAYCTIFPSSRSTRCPTQAVRRPLPTAKEDIVDKRAEELLFFYSQEYDHTRILHFEDCWLPGDGAPAGPRRWEVRGSEGHLLQEGPGLSAGMQASSHFAAHLVGVTTP